MSYYVVMQLTTEQESCIRHTFREKNWTCNLQVLFERCNPELVRHCHKLLGNQQQELSPGSPFIVPVVHTTAPGKSIILTKSPQADQMSTHNSISYLNLLLDATDIVNEQKAREEHIMTQSNSVNENGLVPVLEKQQSINQSVHMPAETQTLASRIMPQVWPQVQKTPLQLPSRPTNELNNINTTHVSSFCAQMHEAGVKNSPVVSQAWSNSTKTYTGKINYKHRLIHDPVCSTVTQKSSINAIENTHLKSLLPNTHENAEKDKHAPNVFDISQTSVEPNYTSLLSRTSMEHFSTTKERENTTLTHPSVVKQNFTTAQIKSDEPSDTPHHAESYALNSNTDSQELPRYLTQENIKSEFVQPSPVNTNKIFQATQNVAAKQQVETVANMIYSTPTENIQAIDMSQHETIKNLNQNFDSFSRSKEKVILNDLVKTAPEPEDESDTTTVHSKSMMNKLMAAGDRQNIIEVIKMKFEMRPLKLKQPKKRRNRSVENVEPNKSVLKVIPVQHKNSTTTPNVVVKYSSSKNDPVLSSEESKKQLLLQSMKESAVLWKSCLDGRTVRWKMTHSNDYCELCLCKDETKSTAANPVFEISGPTIPTCFFRPGDFADKTAIPAPSLNIGSKQKGSLRCEHCDQCFTKELFLRSHISSMHGKYVPKLTCTVCNEKFSCREELQKHKLETKHRKISQVEKYQCEQCGRVFHIKSSYKYHMKYVHTNNSESTCGVCQRPFKTRNAMLAHIKNIHDQSPTICDICGKMFKCKTSMMAHRLRHDKAKMKFTCDYCSKGFFTRNSMKIHVLSHTGEKPFKCDQCLYACKTPQNLYKHMKNHTK